MLMGVDPLLTGALLRHLDAMGHGDGLVVADGNFPAHRLADHVVQLPGMLAPRVLRAILTVMPVEDGSPALMATVSGEFTDVQRELWNEAFGGPSTYAPIAVPRADFYTLASNAYVVVKTGDVRPYGNILVRRGVVCGEQ